MMYTRQIGEARVTNVIEYIGPTHSHEYLFPTLPEGALSEHLHWLAPHHYVPTMQRFVIAMQLWVIHWRDRVIVVDTGVGNAKPRKPPRMNMLNTLAPLWLEAAGATADTVTAVVTTHLHPDHVGWNTRWHEGRWQPSFPKARYWTPRIDFELNEALYNGGQRDVLLGAFEDSVLPVREAGLMEWVGDGDEIAGCLRAEAMPGHTAGSLHYRLLSGGQEGLFCGDIMHSPVQVAMPELNSYADMLLDIAPQTRRLFLERAAQRGGLVMPVHFGFPHCGYIQEAGGGRFRFEPEQRPS